MGPTVWGYCRECEEQEGSTCILKTWEWLPFTAQLCEAADSHHCYYVQSTQRFLTATNETWLMQFLPLLNQYPAEWKRIQGLFQYRSELLVLFFFLVNLNLNRTHVCTLALWACLLQEIKVGQSIQESPLTPPPSYTTANSNKSHKRMCWSEDKSSSSF